MRYKRADRVTERKIGSSLLLVPFERVAGAGVKGIVLKNDSAQLIWKTCGQGACLKDIIEAVTAEFNVDEKEAVREIQDLLGKLLRLELVLCSAGDKKGVEKNAKDKNRRKKKMGKT